MAGNTIHHYTTERELGRGGMATVYLAHDNKFDTHVAIKVLNKEFVHNDNIRKRFLAEARNMFRMSHPNIVKVTDLIDDGDTVAFVMEYVEGETLKEYLEKKGKLGEEEIRAIFTQMLDGVGYVHKQNLVHRDIKPSNFMIDREGKVKLMDFGIAKNTDASAAEYTQTGTGMQMGTPMYMSPEQITETKSVTLQSDIYSLGVVLWQMASGRKPYDVKTLSSFQLQLKIVNEKLEKTNSVWDVQIQKACAKTTEERFINCNDWLRDLINPSLASTFNEDKTVIEYIKRENESHFKSNSLFSEKPEPSTTEKSFKPIIDSIEIDSLMIEANEFISKYNYHKEEKEIIKIYFNYFLNFSISVNSIKKYPDIDSQLISNQNIALKDLLKDNDQKDIIHLLQNNDLL